MVVRTLLVFVFPALLSACASETAKLAEAPPAVSVQPSAPVSQPVDIQPVVVSEAPAQNKTAAPATLVEKQTATPDFYQMVKNWSDAMQTNLAPLRSTVEKCDDKVASK